MKLVVQIPCHDEAGSLADTIAAIPREIEGITNLEVIVIDDGSTDGTGDVARAHGADQVVRLPHRRGLAEAFKIGLDTALRRGADVIVNTDGDNQYEGADVPKLVEPILAGEADIVVGDRDPGSLRHFSWLKRWLQRLGSWTMRLLSGTTVADATSGFRAYSREAALQINVVSDFTYTLETLIQAGRRQLRIADVPIRSRHTPRTSRLAPTTGHYVAQATAAMARAYAMYRPLRVFMVLGSSLMIAGIAIGLRFVWLWWQGRGQGNVQSLILAAILSIVGFQTLTLGIVADLLASNRKLVEEVLYRLRRWELEGGTGRGTSEPVGPSRERETSAPGKSRNRPGGSAPDPEGG